LSERDHVINYLVTEFADCWIDGEPDEALRIAGYVSVLDAMSDDEFAQLLHS
jgi:hypothetical protein